MQEIKSKIDKINEQENKFYKVYKARCGNRFKIEICENETCGTFEECLYFKNKKEIIKFLDETIEKNKKDN